MSLIRQEWLKNPIPWTVGLVVVAVAGAWFFYSATGDVENKNPLAIKSDDHTRGNRDAKAVLIEYLDFECEACGAYYPLVKQLKDEFKDDLVVVARYFPRPGHKNGLAAALAVEAASRQGKFWEMHDHLFDKQPEWGERSERDDTIFDQFAQDIGLDLVQFKKDRNSQSVSDRVAHDLAEGNKLGIEGTPSFFLNGRKIDNPRSPEAFKALIEDAIFNSRTASAEPRAEKVHEHADFAVSINGKKIDFTPAKYQSSKANHLDPDAHLHDGNGAVTHKHRKGVTLGYFFKTLKMSFDGSCFALDTGEKFCNNETNSLKFFVNGEPNDRFGDFEFADLDRILVSYGPKDENVQSQLTSLTDLACMYSEKCPERGKPPTENCVGGLGSEC